MGVATEPQDQYSPSWRRTTIAGEGGHAKDDHRSLSAWEVFRASATAHWLALSAKHDRPILSYKKRADPRGLPSFRSCPPARLALRIVGLLTCGLRSLRPCLRFRGGHQRLRLRGMSLVCEGLGAVCDGRGVGGRRLGCPGEDCHSHRRLFATKSPSYHPWCFLALRPLCGQHTRDLAASSLLRPLRPPTLALGLSSRCAGNLSRQPPFLDLPLRLGLAVAAAAAHWPKPNSAIPPPITRH